MTSSSTHGLTAIVAATKSNGIGLNGTLPWRLPGEMKYFAKVTSTIPSTSTTQLGAGAITTPSEQDTKVQNAVIMGRKTWESIPTKFRPLKDRSNLVISRNKELNLGTPTYDSLSSALSSLQGPGRAFLIGGSQLYNLALESQPPLVDRVLLTRVLSDFECDTFLYDFASDDKWTRSTHRELCSWIGFEVEEENEEKGIKYRYEMWTLSGASTAQ